MYTYLQSTLIDKCTLLDKCTLIDKCSVMDNYYCTVIDKLLVLIVICVAIPIWDQESTTRARRMK